MRIAMVCNHFLPNVGGIEIVAMNIANGLAKRGHDVTILTAKALEFRRAALKDVDKIGDVSVKRFAILPFAASRQLFLAAGIVPELLSADYDLVHVFSYGFSFLTNTSACIAAMRKKALVMTPIYNPIRVALYKGSLSRLSGVVFDKRVGIRILKMAKCVTALSESEAKFYRAHGVASVRVIPEGIDVSRPSQKHLSKFISEYGLTDKTILSVGRIVEYKGQDLLIEAFANVLRRFPAAKLLIVGKDWGYLDILRSTAQKCNCLESVIFTGPLSELKLSCAYESADVVVHTSRFETFARIALEAWSHKKPIVCFDLGGPTEFITEDRGIRVNYGDIEQLSTKIVELLSNKDVRTEMGQNGYNAVRKRHLWGTIVDEYEDVYRFSIAGHGQKGAGTLAWSA
jgi:glycosyltransferase involved in cell wall biosynthesis